MRPNEEAISGRATPTAAWIRGKHCKPAHTPGPLQRLVGPHAGSVEDGGALTESGAELEPQRQPRRWTREAAD
ncbi:hypothetical protein PSMK_19920 [Phycisphaera mikurensis NBRC 102666]|uniref:Uncharacterized protein n=1 Tax=Phycisphaera mikurensis (strain NBRC 102666 / KCTC 22515 / FYK2301M01) TaxID=1142394 RepID=I0IFW3_PHYMF|nr:hypothetical protein PSMK_19920 [Phycisphaera mikurensis NBRC 102666]